MCLRADPAGRRRLAGDRRGHGLGRRVRQWRIVAVGPGPAGPQDKQPLHLVVVFRPGQSGVAESTFPVGIGADDQDFIRRQGYLKAGPRKLLRPDVPFAH